MPTNHEQRRHRRALLADTKRYRDALRLAVQEPYHPTRGRWKDLHDEARRLQKKYPRHIFLRMETIALNHL